MFSTNKTISKLVHIWIIHNTDKNSWIVRKQFVQVVMCTPAADVLPGRSRGTIYQIHISYAHMHSTSTLTLSTYDTISITSTALVGNNCLSFSYAYISFIRLAIRIVLVWMSLIVSLFLDAICRNWNSRAVWDLCIAKSFIGHNVSAKPLHGLFFSYGFVL